VTDEAPTVPVPSAPPAPPAEASQFDFWIGDWDVSWGDGLRGTNRVRKVLGDRVIQEDFDGERDAQLRGLSVSVYGVAVGRWRQTWVDDSGMYLDFSGGWEATSSDPTEPGPRMVLIHRREVEGKPVLLRMVWNEIGPDSLVWRWQRSDDDGVTWATNWRLDYRRRG